MRHYFFLLLVAGNLSNFAHAQHAPPKPTVKPKSSLVIYKDRCILKTEQSFGNQPVKLPVPATIDPQSINFLDAHSIDSYEVKASDGNAHLHITPKPQAKVGSGSDLMYSFTGVNWHMHHVAVLEEDLSTVASFSSFITIDNQTALPIEHATLQLVNTQTDDLAANKQIHEFSVNDARTYNGQSSTRVNWFSLKGTKADQDYRLFVGGDLLNELQPVARPIPLQIWLSLENPKDHDTPLEKGAVTIYLRDSQKHLRYLGISSIDYTPAGTPIYLSIPSYLISYLKPSQASPISYIEGKIEQTEYKAMDEHHVEASYRLDVKNQGPDKVRIKVVLNFLNSKDKVLRQSLAYHVDNDKQVHWDIDIDPKSAIHFRYRVRMYKE